MADRNDTSGTSGRDTKAILKWTFTGALVLYFVAFVLSNRHDAEIDFVFFTATTSMVVVLLLVGLLGMIVGYTLGALRRRRRRHR